MKKSSINWTVKQFTKMMDKGTISFDYPIQRAGSQWDLLQKSLLIHSIAGDYPIPALYSIVQEEEINGKKANVYYILDGKQRLTNIRDFVRNEYMLHIDTPSVVIDDEEYDLVVRNEKGEPIAGKTFDELDKEVRDEIESFSLQIYRLDEITDEQIEELFFRLNNGTPLSKQQKAKAKMGTKWASRIKELVNHELMKEKASFTELQIKKADDETAILQTMMLLDKDYELRSISSNDVFAYAQTFKGNDDKVEIVNQIKDAMEYLNIAFADKESVLLKKVHFPMTLLTALRARDLEIHPLRFSDWTDEFKRALKNKSDLKTDYKRYGGAGSVKKEKALGRVSEMQKHMETYFAKYDKSGKFQLENSESEGIA